MEFHTQKYTLRKMFSKPQYLGLDFSDRSGIWAAPRQQCCRDACQISKRYDYNDT